MIGLVYADEPSAKTLLKKVKKIIPKKDLTTAPGTQKKTPLHSP